MKIFRIICLIGWGCLTALSLQAQKKVPHSFQYTAEASEEGELKEITQVSHSGTSSIRLYFDEVELGPNSYLLLEGSDGAEQKLNAEALKNWSNSSAYFNGQSVKVSLYQAAGEEVKVKLKELKVNEAIAGKEVQGASQARKITSAPASSASGSYGGEINLEETPWAAAVGRFTDGVESYGTGWIAPNGAIVTSSYIESFYIRGRGYDIIEFNVPPSNPDGSVNHPGPEDQYPVVVHDPRNYSIAALFYFKRRTGLDAGNEPGLGITRYRSEAAIIEALPNSTGLLPGERQQQYFRIAANPSSFILGGAEFEMDILHYGSYARDLVYPEERKTLRKTTATMLPPNEYLRSVHYIRDGHIDRDEMIIYHGDGEKPFSSSQGAPITHHETNVAIGVHHTNYVHAPAGGLGFANDFFRDKLDRYFTYNGVYVDSESLYDPGNGDIHKPYLRLGDGINAASDDAIVYIAKGSYNESITINKPMTLKAPVGAVVIGAAGGASSRMMRTNIPAALYGDDPATAFAEEEDLLVEPSSLKSFPNPFVDHTELHYTLTEDSPVQVKVFDMLGQEVHTLVQDDQHEGEHRVRWDGRTRHGKSAPTGLYIMQLKTGEKTYSVRVIKQ